MAGLCLPAGGHAAEREQLPQPLTLNQALSWAGQYNPTLRGARIELRRSEGVLEHADVAVPSNPQLQLGTAEREGPSGATSTDIDIRLSQTFWIAGQGGLREDAAKSRLSGAQSRLDFLGSATFARVRAAFLQALVAERAVATAEDVLQVNRDLENYAKRRLEAGKATRLEANTARIGLGRSQALLAQAENRQAQARLQLAELLAVDPAKSISLQGRLNPAPLELPSQAQLLQRAIARRGDLAAAAREVSASQEELKLAHRQIVPNLTVFGFYGEEETNEITGGGVSFELPLLHRFGGERKQAQAELDAARLERDVLQLTVRSQVLSAVADYEAARQRVAALSDEVVDAARQNFELTQRAFEAGELGAPALTAAQDTLINTRRDYLDALEALVNAGTDLERATGGLVVMSNTSAANSGPRK
ncbi:MAG: TolC family protein [Salinisphaeraceae bacterium]|uniref:TolC family protein n=1 Tax=Spectribacter acetivorans TaxID=3075603 RepID=A0ABU3B7H1_9GAMM|nr:TolC family protein [Salinisphaera sp. P385]MDT0618399.1 TolC family protein [Salinisphaera sp. P385]